jgi:organic hydroperoxide reductase OsmC/OhrA
MKEHHQFSITVIWTGNKGSGTKDIRAYERSHKIFAENKPEVLCSYYRGDQTKYNPEDLLVASLSACHMLWYLFLCAKNGIVVIAYEDNASGIMEIEPNGSGHFTEVVLNPVVTLSDEFMIPKAMELHSEANKMCFIANSVNFPVKHHPKFIIAK